MSPPRHRSNTEGGLTEEQEDELEHIFKVRVAMRPPIPHRNYNIAIGILVCSPVAKTSDQHKITECGGILHVRVC